MQGYKPYIDFLMAGKVSESCYILSSQGILCGTNLSIKQIPTYQIQITNQSGTQQTITIDQVGSILSGLLNNGITNNNNKYRLNKQQYQLLKFQNNAIYLKQIPLQKHGKQINGGACIIKSKTLIIIGTWNSNLKLDNCTPQNQQQLNKRVQILASTLIKQGY